MSEEQRRQLQQQLWNIANTLLGKMGADEFRDYIMNGDSHNFILGDLTQQSTLGIFNANITVI